jgi:hypothetical protein
MSHLRRLRAQSLPFSSQRRARDVMASVALIACVWLFWAHHYRFFDVQTWSQPIDYWGDALFSAGVVKACQEGSYVPFFSKLVSTHGAPFVASWNDFPIPEDLVFCGTGYLARIIGLFAAINVAYLGAGVLAALSLYWVMRAMRVRWQWSFLFGALFGLSPFLFHRTVHHFNLIFYWHAPWCLLLSIWAASRFGIPFRSRRFYFGCAVAAAAGFQNPYFLNFFLQMLALGTLAGALRHPKNPRKKSALSWVAAAGLCFFLSNMDTVFYQVTNGPNLNGTVRSEIDLEQFALKPFDLVFPQPPHVIPAVDRIATRHVQNTVIRTEHEYLGLLGGIALLSTLGAGVIAVMRRRITGRADLAMLTVWLMGYSVVGGLNAGLGAVGFVLFRGLNRASIFIMAISLLAFGLLVSRATRRWHWALQAAVAGLILPFAAYEQVFPRKTAPETVAIHERARADQELVAVMQARLPKGSRVFQIPPVDFPEVSFEPFRPFLWSEGLSYSFGNMRGRPEAAWHHRVAALPPPEMLKVLDEAGFQAIFVLGNGQPLANAFSAIRKVEYQANSAGASLILLNP